jgi:hypothetical protein
MRIKKSQMHNTLFLNTKNIFYKQMSLCMQNRAIAKSYKGLAFLILTSLKLGRNELKYDLLMENP